jgi:hypothetical protein
VSTTYEAGNKAIAALVQHALEKYHPELHKEGVTVDCIIVRKTTGKDDATEDVHALKRAGYPLDAKIGVTSLQDRARGIADAKLMIDGFEWNKATDRQRLGLIDHELEHLTLVEHKPTEKDPAIYFLKDDLGRPKLKVRPHDWELAGFQTVAIRHGEHSHEAIQFANFRTEYAQLNLFGPPDLLAIADGKGGNKKHKPVKGETRVSLKDDKGKVLFEGTDKQFHEMANRASEPDLSRACARRHHTDCKYAGCQCNCKHPWRRGAGAHGN